MPSHMNLLIYRDKYENKRKEIMKRIAEVVIVVSIGLGLGYILLEYPPTPPPGVCDSDGTPEECRDWWHDVMESP